MKIPVQGTSSYTLPNLSKQSHLTHCARLNVCVFQTLAQILKPYNVNIFGDSFLSVTEVK